MDIFGEFKKLSGLDKKDKELEAYVREFLYANGSLSANELILNMSNKIEKENREKDKECILKKLKDIIGIDDPTKTEFTTDPDKKDVPQDKLPKKVLAEDDDIEIPSDWRQKDAYPDNEFIDLDDVDKIDSISHEVLDSLSDKIKDSSDYEWMNIEDVRSMVMDNIGQGVTDVESIVQSIMNTKIDVDEATIDKTRTFVAQDDRGEPLFSVQSKSDEKARLDINRQKMSFDAKDLQRWEKSNKKLDIREDGEDKYFPVFKVGDRVKFDPKDTYGWTDWSDSPKKEQADMDAHLGKIATVISADEPAEEGWQHISVKFDDGYEFPAVYSWHFYDVKDVNESPMDRNPLSRYPDQIRALRDMRQTIGATNDKPVQSTTLSYSDERSNKYHYFAILQRPDGTYVAANAYARIGYNPKISVFASGDLNIVRKAYDDKVQSKLNKGYVEGGPRAKGVNEAEDVSTDTNKEDQTDFDEFQPDDEKQDSQDKFDSLNKDVNYDKDRIKEGDTVEVTAKDSKELIVPPTTVSKVTMIRVPSGEEYLTVTFADGYSYSEEDYTINKYGKSFKDTKDLLNQSYDQYLNTPKQKHISEDLKRIIELSNHKIK